MSNSTLDKLLDVPRDKTIGAAGQGTASPGSINPKRARNASSSDDEDQTEERQGDVRQGEEEDGGNVNDDEGILPRRVPEWFSNGIKMSGPVTDL
ncbi:uncharacterized protein LOC108625764 isoform X2 [Ceratina calcarata]|uniref:Uncharacterized protein LOC108625764 isoform X2 n=1 Tax=Ceratina calcarata TaxID=156304 RepID=A0AAJ7N7J3_9HYME|nr:uncharacterized protein LOC108625764 isoform X2 [Ceratina calcarata]